MVDDPQTLARRLSKAQRRDMEARFDLWMDSLNEDVIQGEYGYERGEFDACPEDWRPMFDEGLSPAQAFRRALDAFAEERAEQERLTAENWARIQAADAALRTSLLSGGNADE